MLRTNLSTRPFYNERAVHAALGLLALVLLTVTALSLWKVFDLSARQAQLQQHIQAAESSARQARADAARVRSAINPQELNQAVAEARDANTLIERRVFSWTDLFNRFEATLPEAVRITSIRPKIDRDGTMIITLFVAARHVEGIQELVENLEKDGGFAEMISREEFLGEDGLLQATLEGRYLPAPRIERRAPGGRP
jgi:Tfp pilus assembly protein PilN